MRSALLGVSLLTLAVAMFASWAISSANSGNENELQPLATGATPAPQDTTARAITQAVLDRFEGTDGNAMLDDAIACRTKGLIAAELTECIGASFFERSGDDAVTSALLDLKGLIDADPDQVFDCHNVAHYLGRNLALTVNIDDLVAAEDGTCNYGLIHGSLEGFAQVADTETFDLHVASVCVQFDTGSVLRHNCVHGLGHALLIRAGHAGFEAMSDECLVFTPVDRTDCFTAVMMAYSGSGTSLSDDVQIDIDPLSPAEVDSACIGLDESFKRKCWEGLWQLYPYAAASDLSPIVDEACRAAPGAYQDVCFSGLGQLLFLRGDQRLGWKPEELRQFTIDAVGNCPADYLQPCVEGAVASSIAWWAAANLTSDGFLSACAELDESVVQTCRAVEQEALTDLGLT